MDTIPEILVEPTDAQAENPVLVVRLNRPEKKNALTKAMYQKLSAILKEAEQSSHIHVVLLTGLSECFTAGNDLKDFLESSNTEELTLILEFLKTISSFTKPLVAAINGPCIGIGCTLLLHCDFVYAGNLARFHMPFTALGLTPEAASSYLLPRIIGHQKACQYLMLGEVFGAHEALAMGLINEVVSTQNYFQYAYEKAHQLSKLPLASVLLTKKLLKLSLHEPIQNTLQTEAGYFVKQLQNPDTQNILKQFFKK